MLDSPQVADTVSLSWEATRAVLSNAFELSTAEIELVTALDSPASKDWHSAVPRNFILQLVWGLDNWQDKDWLLEHSNAFQV